MTTTEFIAKYKLSAQEACEGTPIKVSVCLAQAALETGWGKYAIGRNLFGVKATGKATPYWDGKKCQTVWTTEYVKGIKKSVRLAFRDYATTADSIRDHNYIIINNSRYKRVLAAKTAEEQCDMLQACGYATDPRYASKLKSIINTHNLKQYDK